MKAIKKKILFVLYLFLPFVCFAQSGKFFTADKELSSSLINKIYQDKDEVIWIATEDGLDRYDGAKFISYRHDPNDVHSLVNNFVKTLFEDRKGHFFVGTLSGLQIYNPATDLFSTIRMKAHSGEIVFPNISSIIERKNGDVLVGTSGQGIFSVRFAGDKAVARQIKPVSSYSIYYLYEDNGGNLWISTEDKGLFCWFKNNRIKNYFNGAGMVWNTISSIIQDNKNTLFVGSLGKGLFRYDINKDEFFSIPYSNPNLPVKTLYMSSPNEILVGTDGNGMKMYNIKEKKLSDANLNNITAFNFNKSKVHSILKDKKGDLWLGFYQKGVVLFPSISNMFKYIGYRSSAQNLIGSNSVISVYIDHAGRLWIGTDDDGIYRIGVDRKTVVHFSHSNSPHSVPSTVLSIYEDSNRNLWIGSYLSGMAKLNPENGYCEYVNLRDSKSNYVQKVYCFAEDNDKNLWIGTMGAGLYYMNINTGKIDHCKAAPSGFNYRENVNILRNGWINCLLHTKNNKLYIGTYDGLGCLDIKTMNFSSTYRSNRLLKGEVIYSLYEDSSGMIWIGTSEGLISLNPRTRLLHKYTIRDGLPSNVVCAIQGDGNKNLWVSTNYGVSKFSLRNKNFINYFVNDGLQGNEFSKNAAYTDKSGEIVFGGTNGITYFNPADIVYPNYKPEIRISGFYIHDKVVKQGMKSGPYGIINTSVMKANKFHLSYRDNSFSIEFSTMEFYNPERITYMYSMNNNNWIYLSPGANRLSFNDLAPGTYHFRVKAKDHGFYSDAKEIIIVISPPWYASWWAESLYVILLLLVAYFIFKQLRHRYRIKQEMMEHIHAEQIKEAKLQFFINISHEIRTPMSLIISPLQKLIMKDKDSVRQSSYKMIFRNSQRILRLINQLMDVRKIDRGQMSLKFQETDIVSFIDDLLKTFEYESDAKKIRLSFEHENEILNAWVDPENFDKIILNLLSNAFKFTPSGGDISIALHTGEGPEDSGVLKHYFEITVSDNGEPIDEMEMDRIFERFYQIRNEVNNSNPGTGIGLHLVKTLVELHHGTIKVKNNSGARGCSFIVRLPLGKEHLRPDEIPDDNLQMTLLEPIEKESGTLMTGRDKVNGEDFRVKTKTKYHVLVVEDDQEISGYICKELKEDFHMSSCVNGKEALAYILRNYPDLVVSDIMMPVMDGFTLCRKIKQNININHIPVILLTAKTRDEDNLEGLSIGADAYITKPFNIEILKMTAENLIKGRDILRNFYEGNQEHKISVSMPETQSHNTKLMNRIMFVINQNISNPDLNVEMISKEVGISRVHLYRKLKELTNQSTRDFIRNIRLREAAVLLSENKYNVTEVASLTGFTSITLFSGSFKELYGMTPSEYAETKSKERLADKGD